VHAYPLVVSFPGDIDRGTATTLSRDVNGISKAHAAPAADNNAAPARTSNRGRVLYLLD
jgi:hypothetical protein